MALFPKSKVLKGLVSRSAMTDLYRTMTDMRTVHTFYIAGVRYDRLVHCPCILHWWPLSYAACVSHLGTYTSDDRYARSPYILECRCCSHDRSAVWAGVNGVLTAVNKKRDKTTAQEASEG